MKRGRPMPTMSDGILCDLGSSLFIIDAAALAAQTPAGAPRTAPAGWEPPTQ